MDASAELHESDERRRSDPFLAVAEIFKLFMKRLVSFFAVTEEERQKAGIVWRQRP